MRNLFIRLLPSILLAIVVCACASGVVSSTHKAIATPTPTGVPIPVYGSFSPFLKAFLTDLQLKDYHDLDTVILDQELVLYCDSAVSLEAKCQYTWGKTRSMLASGQLKLTSIVGVGQCFPPGYLAADTVTNAKYRESNIPNYTPTQGYAQMIFIDWNTTPNSTTYTGRWYLMAIVLNARC